MEMRFPIAENSVGGLVVAGIVGNVLFTLPFGDRKARDSDLAGGRPVCRGRKNIGVN